MAFADLKNDFVFRRIFATHPDLLRSLLNATASSFGDIFQWPEFRLKP